MNRPNIVKSGAWLLLLIGDECQVKSCSFVNQSGVLCHLFVHNNFMHGTSERPCPNKCVLFLFTKKFVQECNEKGMPHYHDRENWSDSEAPEASLN